MWRPTPRRNLGLRPRRSPPRSQVTIAEPCEFTLTENQRRALEIMNGVSNVFIFGPPGSGKTTLLDLLHAARSYSRRWHFGDFFRLLHERLPEHGRSLPKTLAALTGEADLVLFDEFHLHDVADAVYLDRALQWWKAHGTQVLATSNYRPSDLLPNPLLHSAAEPVIGQIVENFEVFSLDDGVDHRGLGSRRRTQGFASGQWTIGTSVMSAATKRTISIGGRRLAVSCSAGAESPGTQLAFTFAELCGRPWSTSDYLILLRGIDGIALTDVPSPQVLAREPAQRFANLVDVVCDRDIRLDVFAAGPPDELRFAPSPPLDVGRTLSRLALLSRQ